MNSVQLNSTLIEGHHMSLATLWRLLEEQRRNNGSSMASVVGLDEAKLLVENNRANKNGMTTLELVIIQSILLALLVVLSVVWAFCCKKRCVGDQTLGSHVAAFARKLSTGSSRELPPSYSKVDLTSVGLTLNDHLNPPPTYDRLISMLESGEITSVPIHLHPEIERRMSLASSATSSRKSSGSSRKSSRSRNSSESSESRKSSRVTFAPNLIDGPASSSSNRKASSQSLPLTSVLSNPMDRKKSSSKSEGSNNSRKVSFIDSLTGISAQPNPQLANQLAQQLEIVKEAGEMGEFLQQQPSTTTTTSNFK
jgi:hypothetical protein